MIMAVCAEYRMHCFASISIALFLSLGSAFGDDLKFQLAPNFLSPPPGRSTIGNGHGEIGVDAAGNIYVSVQEKDAGMQVYSPKGEFLKALPLPASLHGFVIRKTGAGEFIFAPVLNEQRVIQCALDGKVVMEIPTSEFPTDKIETEKDKKLHLTSCDIAPNGDIYVVDGYGQSWIFVFTGAGKFKKVFGGPVEPLKLSNCHKIFVDPRFDPPRLFLCDRGNNRILHLDLEGNMMEVIAKDGLRRPSSASFYHDLVCIAEIAGRVSVWDKEGKQVAVLGVNDTPGQTNTPKVEPKDWHEGVVTSPHGITFDAKGDILETEWNQFGRVLRWNRVP
jgi:hypothetical protein